MIKKIFITFLALLSLPVFAGELESAMASKNKVVLYLYTQECGYCKKFNPIYNKISKMYDKKFAFVKLDANTQYGYSVFCKYKGRYVPYVILIDSKTKNAYHIPNKCATNVECFDKTLKKFN